MSRPGHRLRGSPGSRQAHVARLRRERPPLPRAGGARHAPERRLPDQGSQPGGLRRDGNRSRAYAPARRAPARDARLRPDWVEGWPALRQISDDIARPLDRPPSAAGSRARPCRWRRSRIGVGCVSYQIATGIGMWGLNKTRRVGVRHHQLRLLDRHRPRRHADLRDPAAVPAEAGACRSTARPRR